MKRRGVLLIEVLAACGLTAVLLALCVQVLSLTALERRHIERRAIALQEAANLVERAAALPFQELTDSKLAELSLSPEVVEILPKAKSIFTVSDEPGKLPARRVRVEIRWQGRGGREESPVHLTFWAFAPQPATGPPTSEPSANEPPAADFPLAETPSKPDSPTEKSISEAAAAGVEP